MKLSQLFTEQKQMDILDKLLAFSQISAGINVKCQLQGNWQLDTPQQNGQAVAHIVSHGTAFLHHNKQIISLKQGDIVFFPRTAHHTLSNQTEITAIPPNAVKQLQGGFTLTQIGKPHSDCDLFCLHFRYDNQAELMENLPEMLILHIAETPLAALVEMLKQEAQSPSLASSSLVNSLALVILTMILREHLSHSENDVTGVLKGWQEVRLRPLLKAILLNPEQHWQVDEMAKSIYLSRSQLVRLFNKHLGTSPHAFVHKIRLQKAAMLLKKQADSVLSIALACGFQSEPHFITAFKKHYGNTPSQYRQNEKE